MLVIVFIVLVPSLFALYAVWMTSLLRSIVSLNMLWTYRTLSKVYLIAKLDKTLIFCS